MSAVLYVTYSIANQQHAFAKELIAGFAGAEVDKLFETKGMSNPSNIYGRSLIAGLDAYDREEAKRHARQQAEQALNQSGQF